MPLTSCSRKCRGTEGLLLNDERTEHYRAVTRKRKPRKKPYPDGEKEYTQTRREPTPGQWRRLSHKLSNRKTHDHDRTAVPEGQKFRCLQCRPLPAVKVPVKAAGGPRDWSQN